MPHVITLNAGSSSIKFALFALAEGAPRAMALGLVEQIDVLRYIKLHDAAGIMLHEASWEADASSFYEDALTRLLDWRRQAFPQVNVVAVGHRVVHGGLHYSTPMIITDAVLDALRRLIPLAPLHQPHNIAGIEAARQAWPHVQQVACFDTGFHRGHNIVNDLYALPLGFYQEGMRRYGFHGLSYEYVSKKLREFAPNYAAGRIVAAHLGAGASMCAILNGRSISSSMGFTALDGLPMATRCGQLDAGLVLYLLQEKGMSAESITELLYHQSGLKGLSGLSGDMRELLLAGTEAARTAIAYFVVRIRRELGGLAAVLQGLDGVVFCGGIGEHAWQVRAQVLQGMEWIGIELDHEANRANAGIISAAGSRVRVFIIPTNEEAMIAQHTLECVTQAKEPAGDGQCLDKAQAQA